MQVSRTKMKYTITIAIILTFLSTIMINSHSAPLSEDYEKLANAITTKTAKKIHDEKGLILVGTGGEMMDDIKMMMMGFDSFKIVDIETARKLLAYCVEEYLSAINTSKEIRPYLHDYPFTSKNVEIVIYFRNPDGSTVALNKINVASAQKGEVVYFVDYPEKFTLKTIHKETYEEALQAISYQ